MKVFFKKTLSLILLFVFTFSCAKKQDVNNIIYQTDRTKQKINKNNKNEKPRKKIAILTDARQGGGLLMIADGFKNALEEKYDIIIVDILKDRMFVESIFPYCSRTQSWLTLKILVELQPFAEFFIGNKHYNSIKQDFINIDPDLIISVSPVINKYYWKIAKELNKPFWVAPTDYNHDDIKLLGIPNMKKEEKQENFRLFMYINDENNKKLKEYGIESGKNLTYIQFPVRKEFLSFVYDYNDKKQTAINEITKMKKENNISENDRSVFISLGANTFMADVVTDYIKIIDNAIDSQKQFNGKLTIFIACGNNKELKEKLLSYQVKSKDIIIKPVGWIDAKEMAKYELLADTVIIKPGGNSFTEALTLQQNKVFIYKDSTYAMKWEKANLDFTKEYGCCSEFKFTWEDGYEKDVEEKIFNRLNNNKDIKTKKPFPKSNFYKVTLEEVDKILANK